MPVLRFGAAILVSVLVVGASNAQALPLTGKPARVDRFGDALPPGTLFRIGTSRLQLDRQIQAIAASPDGKLVAAVSDDILGVWEVPSGREILRRACHSGGLLAFSPDSKLLAFNANQELVLRHLAKGHECKNLGFAAPAGSFAADCKTIAVIQPSINGDFIAVAKWDLASGKRLNEWPIECELQLESRHRWVTSTFSRDGMTLATLESHGKPAKQTLCLHDGVTGKVIRSWDLEGPILREVVFSPDGRLLAGTGADAVARAWEAATGKELARWKTNGGVGTGGFGFTFSPDGATILCTQSSGIARWDWQTGKLVQEYPDVGGPIAFPAGGKILAVQGALGSIRLLDLESGADLCPLPRAGKHVTFSADARRIAWSEGSAIVLAETQTGKEVRRWHAHARFVGPLAFAPDGKTIASAGTDRRIRIWDVVNAEPTTSLIKNGVDTLFFSPNGRRLVSVGLGEVCLWDAATGDRLGLWAARRNVAMAPNLRTVAVPDSKGSVLRLFDPITGERLHELAGYGAQVRFDIDIFYNSRDRGYQAYFFPVYSSDGRLLLFGGRGGPFERPQSVICLWDVAAGKKLPLELSAREFVAQDVKFSPDGLLLAALRSDRKMCLLSTASGETVRVLGETEGDSWPTPAFTPDGRILVTATRGLVQFWEVASGREITRYTAHRDDVRELIVSADGRCLATTSWDHAIVIWDLTRLATDDRPRDAVLAAAELPALWADLASPTAVRGRRAIEILIAAPEQAVLFLRARLKPAPRLDAKKLALSIADLGSDVFERRQEAEDALDRLGPHAGPALRQALAGDVPLEARRRIEQLLAKLERKMALSGEPLRIARTVQVLEGVGNAGALAMLRELARGDSGAFLTEEAAAAVRRLEQRATQAGS